VIRFVLPGLPPSVNNYLSKGRRMVWLEPKARAWMEACYLHMLGQKARQPHLGPDSELYVDLRLYGGWQTSGKRAESQWRRIDLDNRIKPVLDMASKALGFNDCRITKIVAEKVESESERTEVDVHERREIP